MHCLVPHRENININDALGDYSLTLVDALDSLAVSLYVKLVYLNVMPFLCSCCAGNG